MEWGRWDDILKHKMQMLNLKQNDAKCCKLCSFYISKDVVGWWDDIQKQKKM